MDVLITGASGRIGSSLADDLTADGHGVRAFGLAGDERLAAMAGKPGVRMFVGDLLDVDSLVEPARGVDAVVHLAAALTTHDVHDDLYVDVNFRGTYNLLAAVREHAPGVRRFVYTSSDAVYWPALTGKPVYLPVDESHPLMAGSVYGATKVGAEAMCRAFARSYGVPFTIIRPTATASPAELIDPGSPFGRRWFLDAAVQWLERHERTAAQDELLGMMRDVSSDEAKLVVLTDASGVPSLTMITDARDVAHGMKLALTSEAAADEAFNLGPAAPHSDRELVGYLGEVLGLDVAEVSYGDVRPSWYVSSAKARGVLGYEPKWSVFEMIDEAVEGGTR